jgi:hypothetical protein
MEPAANFTEKIITTAIDTLLCPCCREPYLTPLRTVVQGHDVQVRYWCDWCYGTFDLQIVKHGWTIMKWAQVSPGMKHPDRLKVTRNEPVYR